MDFDEDAARWIEAVYQTPDVTAQRNAVLDSLQLVPGETALDIGVGPGLLAKDMAASVGKTGACYGIDVSAPMITMTQDRCADMPWARFEVADATDLPFDDGTIDAATSTQVYEYVEDMPLALKELFRVLKPGGRAAILDTDYDSLVLHTEHPDRMARVMTAWDDHFVHRSLPQVLSPLLRDAGFVIRQRDAIPMFNPEFHRNTFSYGIVKGIADFATGRNGISEEEANAWYAEQQALGADGRYFFSINRFLFLVTKP
ncbi:MAG: methyltransferase domain-containing protein [Alphaproteobacteria bacterium]